MAGDGFGDDELGGVVLGGLLEAGGDVDGVADGGEVEALAPAHPADDGGAGVDADADAQRRAQVDGELRAQRGDALDHGARGRERLTASPVAGPDSMPKSAITPSPVNWFVTPPARVIAVPTVSK